MYTQTDVRRALASLSNPTAVAALPAELLVLCAELAYAVAKGWCAAALPDAVTWLRSQGVEVLDSPPPPKSLQL